MKDKPTEPFVVDWTVGGTGTDCMSDLGTPGKMEVSKKGLTCYEVGYVTINDYILSKCHWSPSFWTLEYKSTGAPYWGSAKSQWSYWFRTQKVQIANASPDTRLCPSQALCLETMIEWQDGHHIGSFVSDW
jgi:hypothetical protein